MNAESSRILDANFNRAREAFRVMEDYARFVLDDVHLCEQLKHLRHELAATLQTCDIAAVIVTRDTPGDVGTTIRTDSEYRRVTAGDVAKAAGKRLSEALRVLEEYGKTISSELAVGIERIRYRGYDVEKRLVHTINARNRWANVRLYVLITASLCREPWQEVVKAAAEGGAGCFQLREKGMPDRELLERACEFRELCHECGTLCIINDRPDIAVASGADGVHVGQDDMDVAAARRVVGPQRIIGVSTHSSEQAQAATAQCPDYVAVGPMFSTVLKPEHKVAGSAMLTAVRKHTSLPLVAIGGINPDNIAQVIEAGAACVAVCSAIVTATDPADVARLVCGQWRNADPGIVTD